MVYDMAQKSSSTTWDWGIFPPHIITSTSPIVHRTFLNFTQVTLLLGINALSYNGGYSLGNSLVSPPPQDLSPSARQEILTKAASWLNRDMKTSFLGFNKDPANDTFRCDSWVEYVYETAGINGGLGRVWPQYENRVASPYDYTTGAGKLELGKVPVMTITTIGGGTVTKDSAISSTTIYINGVEEATGSGLAQISLDNDVRIESGTIQFNVTETFPDLADGQHTATVTDLAGNQASVGFTIGCKHFLDERLV